MAILVGINTVLKDDPALTARIQNGRNPIRVIMDSSLKIPLEAQVITDKQAKTIIFTSQRYDKEKRKMLEDLNVIVAETSGIEHVNPLEVVTTLGEQGISSLFIEGGGNINATFLENKLVDKVILYFAPKLIGGKNAPTFLEGTGIDQMTDAVNLINTDIQRIGQDFKFIGYPNYDNE